MDLRQQVPITALLHYGRLLERCRAQFTGRHRTALHHSRRLPLSGYSHCHGQALGPSQVLPFLDIELDTVLFEARLPADKLREIKDLLQQQLGANHTTYGFLETFLGKLSFASRVVVQSFSFRVSTAGAVMPNLTPPPDLASPCQIRQRGLPNLASPCQIRQRGLPNLASPCQIRQTPSA